MRTFLHRIRVTFVLVSLVLGVDFEDKARQVNYPLQHDLLCFDVRRLISRRDPRGTRRRCGARVRCSRRARARLGARLVRAVLVLGLVMVLVHRAVSRPTPAQRRLCRSVRTARTRSPAPVVPETVRRRWCRLAGRRSRRSRSSWRRTSRRSRRTSSTRRIWRATRSSCTRPPCRRALCSAASLPPTASSICSVIGFSRPPSPASTSTSRRPPTPNLAVCAPIFGRLLLRIL